MAPPIITLTTDFGSADGFPAAMKGAVLGVCPDARIVDLAHEVPPQDVAHASFVLGAVAQVFSPGTIHVAVVDPGVGGERRPLAIAAPDGSLFVGPDNGVFSHAVWVRGAADSASHERPFLDPARASLPDGYAAFAIENTAHMRPVVSRTFHGRDVFAPAAAHLASGVAPSELGPATDRLVALNLPGPRCAGDRLTGRIQYVDRFGNLATDIDGAAVAGGLRSLEIAGVTIPGLSRSYQAARLSTGPGTGAAGCIVASHGYVEVFASGGSAAEKLGVTVGDEVAVRLE